MNFSGTFPRNLKDNQSRAVCFVNRNENRRPTGKTVDTPETGKYNKIRKKIAAPDFQTELRKQLRHKGGPIMKNIRKTRKLIGMILILAMCLSLSVPALAAETKISLEMNGYSVSTEYSHADYYAVIQNRETESIAYIYSRKDSTVVAKYTLEKILTDVNTCASVTDTLRFTHETRQNLESLPVTVCGIKHEVYLEVYQNGSFRQINKCDSDKVIKLDGASLYTIEDPVSIVNPNGGKYPTTKVGCNYAGTCTFVASTTLQAAFEAAGFSVSGSIGSSFYYTKRMAGSWDITVMS